MYNVILFRLSVIRRGRGGDWDYTVLPERGRGLAIILKILYTNIGLRGKLLLCSVLLRG